MSFAFYYFSAFLVINQYSLYLYLFYCITCYHTLFSYSRGFFLCSVVSMRGQFSAFVLLFGMCASGSLRSPFYLLGPKIWGFSFSTLSFTSCNYVYKSGIRWWDDRERKNQQAFSPWSGDHRCSDRKGLSSLSFPHIPSLCGCPVATWFSGDRDTRE